MRGETVLIDGTTAVDNVLVSPTGTMNREGEDTNEITLPVGPIVDYTLYFPISYTEELAHHKITVRGHECDVIGFPDHEGPDHVFDGWLGSWDMTVKVRRVDAEYAETITLTQVSVSRNQVGKRTKVLSTIYSGPAQVRLMDASESEKAKATLERETRYFVFPWLDALDDLQTQELFIDWDDRTWDVKRINNVNEKSETASIEAVWHG